MLLKVFFTAGMVVLGGVCAAGAQDVRDGAGLAVVVPAGFKVAWDDGRLNTKRGPQTVTGDAQMAQLWSSKLPRRLMPAEPAATKTQVVSVKVTAISGQNFIQLTTYGDLKNQAATLKWLRLVGLKGAAPTAQHSGKGFQVVLVGPFSTQAGLDRAMALLKGAGHGDVLALN